MLSITFQGLCGIAELGSRTGGEVYMPLGMGNMAHTGLMLINAEDLIASECQGFDPDGTAVDEAGKTVCVWFLHQPGGMKGGQTITIASAESQSQAVNATPFVSGFPLVPLRQHYEKIKQKATASQTNNKGTRLSLPQGEAVGAGKAAEFDLAEPSGDKLAGPFAEHIKWRSLTKGPSTWTMTIDNKRHLRVRDNATISFSNTMPVIGDSNVSGHFDGIYDAVLDDKGKPVAQGDRCTLAPKRGVIQPQQKDDDGVNCIPPTELPPTNEPPVAAKPHAR